MGKIHKGVAALLVSAVCAVATSPAHAQAQLVGKEAPPFSAGEMVNEVASKTLDDCRGEVILIKYWGTR